MSTFKQFAIDYLKMSTEGTFYCECYSSDQFNNENVKKNIIKRYITLMIEAKKAIKDNTICFVSEFSGNTDKDGLKVYRKYVYINGKSANNIIDFMASGGFYNFTDANINTLKEQLNLSF